MKIRKNHVRKRYRYNVNRKTMNKTRKNMGKIKEWVEHDLVPCLFMLNTFHVALQPRNEEVVGGNQARGYQL